MKKHKQNNCLKRLINCDDCGDSVTFDCKGIHEQFECIKRWISCDRCDKSMQFSNKDKHLESECPFREVCCRFADFVDSRKVILGGRKISSSQK